MGWISGQELKKNDAAKKDLFVDVMPVDITPNFREELVSVKVQVATGLGSCRELLFVPT